MARITVHELDELFRNGRMPTRANGSLELGGITQQSECTLQALKVALERAGSSMARKMFSRRPDELDHYSG